jgi:hypothetical protein
MASPKGAYERTPETSARQSEACKRAWADPDKRDRRLEGMRRAASDQRGQVRACGLTQREIVQRGHARKAVREAGLPLLRRIVDRAAELFVETEGLRDRGDVVIDALLIEFRRAQK